MQKTTVSNDITDFVKAQMDGRRLSHTMAVVEQCAELAGLFSLTETQRSDLITAAWLHDITKCKSHAENLDLYRRFGIVPGDDELLSPKILHQSTGALIARERFPDTVNDEVYTAVSVHTTGGADMSLVSKLLYLADYIEPTRTFPDCVALREYFYKTNTFDIKLLDETLILSLDMTIKDIIRSGDILSPRTVVTRNYLISKIFSLNDESYGIINK